MKSAPPVAVAPVRSAANLGRDFCLCHLACLGTFHLNSTKPHYVQVHLASNNWKQVEQTAREGNQCENVLSICMNFQLFLHSAAA